MKRLYERASKVESSIANISYDGNASKINRLLDVADRLKKAPEVRIVQINPFKAFSSGADTIENVMGTFQQWQEEHNHFELRNHDWGAVLQRGRCSIVRDEYLVSKWALIRRNELVDIPDRLEIHPDFLQKLSHAEFESAFKEIGKMFYQMYSDIADSPQRFGLPLYKVDEYDYFSNQAREARTAPWNLFYFMFCLFACGNFNGNIFAADTAEVRKINKAKKTNFLLEALCDYGFVFDGIKKYSLSSGECLAIDYPDNRNIIGVLAAVAKKVKNIQLKDVKNYYSNLTAFSNAFIGWNYRVLAEDMYTCSLAEGCDYVADKMHTEADREAISVLDKILTERGYTRKKGDPNEGPSVRYYCKQSSAYDYALTSDRGKLYLELRIRNAERCLEYLTGCPERIVEVFRHSDNGCKNRINGSCRFGVKYEFEKEEKWHCGCCGAPFKIHPVKEDIPHYLKLMELGGKR